MNQAQLPEIASWAGITQGTNSLNLHGLFCKTRPPVSFVISKFLKQNLVKIPFHFVSQQKTRRSVVVFDVALAARPIRNNTFEIN